MRKKSWVLRMVWIVVILLAIIGIAAIVRRLLVLWSEPSGDSVRDLLDAGFAHHRSLTLLHILPGLVFMVLGPLQFVRGLRARAPAFHRWSGRVFFGASLVIGVSALAMSWQMSIGGFNETMATTIFAIFFLVAIVKGFVHVRRREFARHREWMLRAFAVGLAVATIRPIIGIFFGLYMARHFLSPREFFGIAFWIGFTMHLIAAEVWINNTRAEGAGSGGFRGRGSTLAIGETQ